MSTCSIREGLNFNLILRSFTSVISVLSALLSKSSPVLITLKSHLEMIGIRAIWLYWKYSFLNFIYLNQEDVNIFTQNLDYACDLWSITHGTCDQKQTNKRNHKCGISVQKLRQMDLKWSSVSHVTSGTTLIVLEQHKIVRSHGVVSSVSQSHNQKDKR